MEATKITKTKITVVLSLGELAFICNAINETLEAVQDWEFQTRTGENREFATAIHHQFCEMLKTAGKDDHDG